MKALIGSMTALALFATPAFAQTTNTMSNTTDTAAKPMAKSSTHKAMKHHAMHHAKCTCTSKHKAKHHMMKKKTTTTTTDTTPKSS